MRKQSAAVSVSAAIACVVLLSVAAGADGGRLGVVVGGVTLRAGAVLSILADSDAVDVDSATAVIQILKATQSPEVLDDLVIDAVGGSVAPIFSGEIVGVEPLFETGGSTQVKVVALNRLHRLTRERKSRTFENMSDADITARLAQEAGLVAEVSGPEVTIKYDHVFQHNQTDLEFLRVRAARIGYELFADGSTLHFRRRLEQPLVTIGCGPTSRLSAQVRLFHPRLASPNQVSGVTVRGWNPERNEEISAAATRRIIPLSEAGTRLINPPGTLLDLGFVRPLETEDAAHGAAVGTLSSVTALDVSGEADADGSPELRIGAHVSIDGVGAEFNGEYFVNKVSHRFDQGRNEGWHTLLRMTRADRGAYVLPEIGDEVLVAFEHGDIRQPIIVGSLWDGAERPPTEEPTCRRN